MHLLPLFAGLATALTIQPRQSLPTGVKIDEITYSGTGCDASTVAGTGQALTDVQHFPVPQKIFRAETGANNTAVADTRRNCVVSVKVSHPAGWQFALTKVDFYGRVYVPLGVECTSRSNYTFAGSSAQLTSRYYFDGPFDGLYFRNDRYVGTARQWSACGSGATLQLSSEVRVGPNVATAVVKPKASYMEIYNIYGGRLGIDWRKC